MALYVVTGAAGFIGSHLVDALLSAGHGVRGLDDFSTGLQENLDPRCQVIRADVADPSAVSRAMQGAVGCFHLAAVASVARTNEDWLGTHRTNQTGTIAVLDAARRCGNIPVVYASSAAVYGDLGRRLAREDMLPKPITAYGADKLGSELHATAAWLVHGVPTFGLRFFNVYGMRQSLYSPYTGVISIFAKQIGVGTPVTVHGDGLQVRDFVHVTDVIAHLTAAMRRLEKSPGAHVINVGTGRGTTVLDLVRILGEAHGRVPRVVHGPVRVGDIRQSVGSPAAAASLLGIRADTSLEDGLAALIGLQSAAA
jgi:UDP-glucose 4-epimerase